MNIRPMRPEPDVDGGAKGHATASSVTELDPDVDDLDESLNRYGSLERSNRWTHRVVSPQLLSALTGIRLWMCESFHHVLFELLESIGDFDGLIATPNLVIGPTPERFDLALATLSEHPAPSVDTLVAALDDADEYDDGSIGVALVEHSLLVAAATSANPSLTFGSVDAVVERLIDKILVLVTSCRPDQIEVLTSVSFGLLHRLASTTRLCGDAETRAIGDPACWCETTRFDDRLQSLA